MKKQIVLAFLACVLLLTGCGTVQESTGTYEFTDSLGNLVSVRSHPETVAVLYSSYAETWELAGGEVSVTVGEAVQRGFAPEDAILVDEGAGHSTLNTELLIAAQPDLVIGTAEYPCQVEAAELCREIGIPCALFTQDSAEEYLSMLHIFCDLTGDESKWEENGKAVQTQMEEIRNCLPLDCDTSVLLLRVGTGARSTKAKGSEDTMVGRMLSELGVRNIADEAPVLLDGLSLEVIIQEDPDWILITTMGDDIAAQEYAQTLLASPGWSELSAVNSGRYVFLQRELFHYKPNNRWPEAWDMLISIFSTEPQI